MKITLVIPLSEGGRVEGIGDIEKQKIKHIEVYGSNPSANRNQGVIKADTEYVAFINGHSTLTGNWLREVEDFFRKHPETDIVGGPQLTSEDEPLFGKASGYALSSKFGVGGVSSRYNVTSLNLNADETMLTSANLICKRKVFEKIKFDENLYPGEDPKFISDAIKNGMKVAYSPDIRVFNKRRDNLGSFAKQIYLYGFTRAKREKLSETIKNPAFLAPPAFFLYILLLTLTFLVNRLIIPIYLYSILNLLIFLPLLFYLALDLFFSVYEVIRKRGNPLGFVLLLILFPAIHLSYGWGFIRGKI